MLSTRTAEATTGVTTQKIITTRGCPQGGVLSPLLWSLVVDELLEHLTSLGIRCLGFADDIVITAYGKFEETLCDIIQRGLSATSKWCLTVGLNINPAKTTIVPFTRKRLLPHIRPIQLAGKVIELKREVKYLGITLDSKLLWNKHLEITVGKATKALMICRRLANKSWGCKPNILRWMYTMMVRPIITYGAVVWHKRTELVTTKKTLNKVQRLACLCITGSMRTCPTAAMEVILHLTPLHEVISSTANGTILRFAKEETGTGKSIGLKERDSISNTTVKNLLDIPRDCMIKKYNFEKNFQTQFSSKAKWVSESTNYTFNANAIKWYTDGSRTADGTGAGIFGPRTKISIPMGQFPSIFQAEINAIDKCAERNLERKYKNQNIAIMSDSQAALKAINSYAINSKLVWECVKKLNELGKANKITLYWVPGHVGVQGNEVADSLAKAGATAPLMGPEPYCGIGDSTIKQMIKTDEEAKRTKIWKETPKLRQAKSLLGNYNQKRFKTCINLSRNNLRIITGILTGHCKLRKHLNNIGLADSATCRFCNNNEETPEHILGNCEALMHNRHRYLGQHQVTSNDLPSIEILQLIKYLKSIKLETVL
ncbi:uncharacterized protein LOC129915201 [Episyrphus balteatus]|uniref:uncharacterized protein LOC129915201 n=1 Tax=Episyrphus balteatus TaxID=286459 RepID=UPI0024860F8F|nr:uncharacterized protein LOC129915201 [Episyrphus balteatus]